MAWEIVDKKECSELLNLAETKFIDSWYDDVYAILQEETGYEYIGTTSALTDEAHDGNGRSVMFVKYPPIVSVSSVSISSSAISSDRYKVYENYIKLTHTADDTLPETFPAGAQNVLISYTSGLATTPGGMKLAVKNAICTIAQYHLRGASYVNPKYEFATRSEPNPNPSVPTVYLTSVIRKIIRGGVTGRSGRFT